MSPARHVAALLLAAAAGLGCAVAPRPFPPGAAWPGQGIAYGPHRDGQRPGGPSPSRAQLREDLALLAGRWTVLRLYGSDATSEELLSLIAAERLPFKVLLGAWIAPEVGSGPEGAAPTPRPEAVAANRAQVEAAVRLASTYPELVLGLVVGNETQVSWSDHRCSPALLVRWLREARRATRLPVATADDFAYWLEPGSEAVAREVDFLVTHVHPLWNGEPIEGALGFTQRRYGEVARRHPGRPVVLGEAGWATARHLEGEQATLIKGEPGEPQQARFLREFTAWVASARITATWFEAFDERWKGGPHPDEVEKHWGLFRADRTPKAAVAGQR